MPSQLPVARVPREGRSGAGDKSAQVRVVQVRVAAQGRKVRAQGGERLLCHEPVSREHCCCAKLFQDIAGCRAISVRKGARDVKLLEIVRGARVPVHVMCMLHVHVACCMLHVHVHVHLHVRVHVCGICIYTGTGRYKYRCSKRPYGFTYYGS